ncbi:MAG TPA: hemolysin family protein [bacterium]|nr:hemolysin family protein [bacterium]HNT64765.1 hemolysin family protein [bacterium]HOX85926.1 hemolysin family protein [bacterium]HPG45091.1 hemolysin family protein [bacterium]HPM97333.1 hemolysin family protein [bacterium]
MLLLSALFSATETAFFSLNSLMIDKLAARMDKKSKRVARLLSSPRKLLIAILIGNTLVNVTVSSLAALLVTHWARINRFDPHIAMVVNIVLVTFLILLLSEISPKILAAKKPESLALYLVPFVTLIYFLFLPFSILIDKGMNWLIGILKIREREEDKLLQSSEINALLELGQEQGELEADEKEMIHSIFEFGDTIVREIMIPRTDMVCVSNDTSTDDLILLIKEKGHTRIPVYEETIDQIRGIINAKDLLPSVLNKRNNINLIRLARPALFVPESKKIDDLLRLFQKERQHMAIVVDEYGGTAGLVTLEDVLEEIVGEIRDEYDQEVALHKQLDENTYLVDAKIDIYTLNELLGVAIPEKDEYDTLGGFIFELTGAVPQEDEVITYEKLEMVTVKVERNRIVKVKIRRIDPAIEFKEQKT